MMTDFHAAALRLGSDDAPAWLSELHAAGRAVWASTSLPDRKTEAWKYTSLRALERENWLGPARQPAADEALDRCYHIPGLDAAAIVFVNGHYSSALSSADEPTGIEIVRFSEASSSEADDIRKGLGTVVNAREHLFAALNDSCVADGVFVRVRKNATVERPLQVVWLTLPQDEAFAVAQRLLVVMEEGSEVTIVEHFAGEGGFTNGITELIAGPNARAHHYRLHLEEGRTVHIGGVHADLHEGSLLDSFHLAIGSVLKRIDVVVNHRGEGAECNLNGVYLPRHREHVDYHTSIEHRVPRCTTSEVFRGVIGDRARAVFNGRIHIHPDAQKTRAQLSNKNLLTSNQAEVDTKPELEIYADDVQCAHGATVAQLEEQALHYLCSRGISREEAQVMLSFGFINALVDKLPHIAVGDYLRPIIAKIFARGPGLARHIG
jgi:Fe-S cluster assembly protein SufD